MSGPSTAGRGGSSLWQERLQEHCRSKQFHPPVFNIVSDRRGGRTAWSSTVTVSSPTSPTSQQTVQARYWYDGQYVHNAKEDAAEVALRVLTGGSASGSSPTSPTAGGPTSLVGWGRGGLASSAGSSSGASSSGSVGVGAAWPRSPPATGGRW